MAQLMFYSDLIAKEFQFGLELRYPNSRDVAVYTLCSFKTRLYLFIYVSMMKYVDIYLNSKVAWGL